MALGMMQVDLAKAANMPQAHLSKIESGGYHGLNFTALVNLADALKTTVDYLLQRSNDPGEVPDRKELAAVV